MEDPIEKAVLRAVVMMRENLGDEITVDDLARAAMFSKFHFTRVFQRVTGVSPGRFLSALRLQEAKHLLVSSPLTVADISMQVGYNSVGTFSSRFSRSVGMSPTTYRRRAGFATAIGGDAPERETRSTAGISGTVGTAIPETTGMVFVGLFAERVPEGSPVRCAVLPRPGPYRFDAVPHGTWYLLAQSTTGDRARYDLPPTQLTPGAGQGVAVATVGPLTFNADVELRADVELKPMHDLNPPVLLALLDTRSRALAEMGRSRRPAEALSTAA